MLCNTIVIQYFMKTRSQLYSPLCVNKLDLLLDPIFKNRYPLPSSLSSLQLPSPPPTLISSPPHLFFCHNNLPCKTLYSSHWVIVRAESTHTHTASMNHRSPADLLFAGLDMYGYTKHNTDFSWLSMQWNKCRVYKPCQCLTTPGDFEVQYFAL